MLDKRLLNEAKGQSSRFAALIGLGLANGVLAVLQAGFITKVINGAFLEEGDLLSMKYWLGLLLAAMAVKAAIVWIAGICAHSLAAKIKTDIRKRLVDRIFAAGPVTMATASSGELANTLVQGVENLEPYFARYIPQLASAVLIPLLILAVAMPLDVTSGVIMLVTAPLIPVFMILIGKLAEHRSKQQWDKLSRLSAHFLDVMRGLTTLKIFGRSKEQVEVIARMSEQFRDTTLSVLKIAFLSSLALELLTTISIAIIAVSVGLRLLYGQMDFTHAFFLLLLAPEFYLPLRQMGSHFHAGIAGKAAAKSIFALLDVPSMASSDDGGLNPDCQCGVEVGFEEVYYTYENGRRQALNGISLTIRPGDKVALVGPSGAGKSTIISLLLGFIQPDKGRVTINAMPLAKINRNEWLNHIAYVPQMPHLFYGTVADNIRLSKADARLDQVMDAAKAAGAHEFISRLPNGYETMVGEGGQGLSGGERQRLAIARAFLRNAPFIILDEATASLDPYNEATIEQALDRLVAGRTVLIIAHRLTTVTKADKIIVLDQGKAVEWGNHTALLAQNGLYAQMMSAFVGEV